MSPAAKNKFRFFLQIDIIGRDSKQTQPKYYYGESTREDPKRLNISGDEQISVVSVFERTQQRVLMNNFLPPQFKQAKKMIISKTDQNYGTIEDIRKFVLDISFM